MQKNTSSRFQQSTRKFRRHITDANALPQLTIAAAITGLLASLVIVAFRFFIEWPLGIFLRNHSENFEALPPTLHFLLPVGGACLIAFLASKIPKTYYQASVGNVLERLYYFQGKMLFGNMAVQFFGGIICLITGQSVGREGPAVHLGASTASLLGQWCKLPNNSLRILIGCGVAAAISASFNTPIAGVIFAMEVVLMSYSVASFIPIVVAAIIGALVNQLVFTDGVFFSTENFSMHGLWELPLMATSGFIIGLFAALYMHLQLNTYKRFEHVPIAAKLIIAGLVTGCLALIAPEILGLGYDSINKAIMGEFTLSTLAIILFAKIIATSVSIGLGMPGGLIGPQLFIGACLGALIGIVVGMLFPEGSHNSSLYVLLGMVAMMGAVINAPLAALMAVLELTYNPNIIFPSMVIIVVSCLTTRSLCKYEGIFMEQLAVAGKRLRCSPVQQYLDTINVYTIMDRSVITCAETVSATSINTLINNNTTWVCSYHKNQTFVMATTCLTAYINGQQKTASEINLSAIKSKPLTNAVIDERATLLEAQQLFDAQQLNVLLVTDSDHHQIIGVITAEMLTASYQQSDTIRMRGNDALG